MTLTIKTIRYVDPADLEVGERLRLYVRRGEESWSMDVIVERAPHYFAENAPLVLRVKSGFEPWHLHHKDGDFLIHTSKLRLGLPLGPISWTNTPTWKQGPNPVILEDVMYLRDESPSAS